MGSIRELGKNKSDIIFMQNDYTFYNLFDDIEYDIDLVPDDYNKMIVDNFYIYNNYIYRYIGEFDKVNEIPIGCIAKVRNRYLFNPHTNETKPFFSLDNLRSDNELIKTINFKSPDDILTDYIEKYDKGKNIAKYHAATCYTGVDPYTPEIKETDDILCKLIKQVLHDRNEPLTALDIKLTKRGESGNVRAAIEGATQVLSFKKFALICDCIGCDWSITIKDNGTDEIHPLREQLVITNNDDLNVDISHLQPSSIGLVVADTDNALKKIIKASLILKDINTTEYKHRGITSYHIPNLLHSLKTPSEMKISCFLDFCEIFGYDYKITVTDTKTNKLYTSN